MSLEVIAVLAALVAGFAVLGALILRRGAPNAGDAAIALRFDALDRAGDRLERILRDETAINRSEAENRGKMLREEVGARLKDTGDSIVQTISELSQSQKGQLELFGGFLKEGIAAVDLRVNAMGDLLRDTMNDSKQQLTAQMAELRNDAIANSRALREEVSTNLTQFGQGQRETVAQLGDAQKQRLESFAQEIATLTDTNQKRLDGLRDTLETRLSDLKTDASNSARILREDIGDKLKQFGDTLTQAVASLAETHKTRLDAMANEITNLTDTTGKQHEIFRVSLETRLNDIKLDAMHNANELREQLVNTLKQLNDSMAKTIDSLSVTQKEKLEAVAQQVQSMSTSAEQRQEKLRLTVEEKLEALRQDNTAKLEQMRQTVDEKLQGTLEKRLGESFQLVSTQLEKVYTSIGEMQTLANGVGDLKRVLTNVKARGTWGEFQLGNLLEQVLSPDQYIKNAEINLGSGQRVEYAIRLPGKGASDEEVLLPIDAKFPHEDYERLTDAIECGDKDKEDEAIKALENRVKAEARIICEKYISPPRTTDFGILFLPTEGLYAEVLRRPGLADALQRQYRVSVVGPTTLSGFLNCLQMGFRTLTIQKRSSEVWQILAAVKTEFGKYGEVLDSVKKKLQQATDTLDDVAVRKRAIDRRLRSVETLPDANVTAILGPPVDVLDGETAAD